MHRTNLRERGARCDTRVTFLAGLAVGFVAGARAGRERYEQMVKLGRKAVENPTVQKATRAAGSQGHRADQGRRAEGRRADAEARRDGQEQREQGARARCRIPGRNSGDDELPPTANGTRPGD